DVVDECLLEGGSGGVPNVEVARLENETHVERRVFGSAGTAGEGERAREGGDGEDAANAGHRSVPSGEARPHGACEIEVAGFLHIVRGVENERVVAGAGRGERLDLLG